MSYVNNNNDENIKYLYMFKEKINLFLISAFDII